MSSEPVPTRLYFILAREADTAVLFRRGPSKWVQIIRWDTAHDTFDFGQWFHGRIYERRSDLSPDGTKMIYFAQKINRRTMADWEYTYAWTAISKPPYLTALALWPKGDCWHGGGLFVTDRLRHRRASYCCKTTPPNTGDTDIEDVLCRVCRSKRVCPPLQRQ